MKREFDFTLKNITVTVISFFLSLVLVLLTLMTLADVTLFSDRNIMSRISGTTYFSKLSEDVEINCKNVSSKYGVNYNSVNKVITPVRVETDMKSYFNAISIDEPTAGRLSIDEKKLAKEIYDSILSNDTDITDKQKANAQIISAKIADTYKNTIALSDFEEFISFANGWKSGSLYIFIVLAVLAIFLVFVIVTLNGKRTKHRLYRRFAVVGGSSGFTVLALSLLIKFSGVFEKMTFYNSEREYNLFMDYFNECIDSAITVSLCFIIVCMILLALWYLSVSGRMKR